MVPRLNRRGLNEVFSIGPAKTYGVGVFQGVEELLPGHLLTASREGISAECYWKLVSRVHTDDFATTVDTTRELVLDAIRRQMVSDVPICTFLSGGVDSSLVTAVCAEELKKRGEQIHTFSFDFTGNSRNFQPSDFQPSQDRPYADLVVDYLKTDHRYLECGTEDQFACLESSVDARDLPAMMRSIQIGCLALPSCDAFFLMPGDMPVVGRTTFQKLLMARPTDALSVVFPTLGGYRKHPPLVDARLIPEILAFRDSGGLRRLWRQHDHLCKKPAGCESDPDPGGCKAGH